MMSQSRDAVAELKKIDHTLTQIGKTSDLTSQELEHLGISAFKTAGKYGKEASDYLTSIQEMLHAGFSNVSVK